MNTGAVIASKTYMEGGNALVRVKTRKAGTISSNIKGGKEVVISMYCLSCGKHKSCTGNQTGVLLSTTGSSY